MIPASEPEHFPSLPSSSVYNHTVATTLTSATTSTHLTCLGPSHPSHLHISRLRSVHVTHRMQETPFIFHSKSIKPAFTASDERPRRWMSDAETDGMMLSIGLGHVTDPNQLDI